jgi:copper chaperone NosL
MLVSDPRTAAQLVVPGDEPLFFDDLGCLGRYLREHPPRRGATIYVADHLTGQWVPAREAVYVLQPAASTPMDSHLLGYGSASSRDSDPAARGGRPVPVGDVLGERSPEATR